MKSICSGWALFLFALLTFITVSPNAVAGSYYYGISDDNQVHQVDLDSYVDTIVFDPKVTGITNGVAWDETNGRLFYRVAENGGLYTWNRATNTQQILGGAALYGFNSNAAFYNGAYWYIADNTDILVRAVLDFSNANKPQVLFTQEFSNFDGTSRSQFLFGDITISNFGVLYASSNYGLFSVSVPGVPSQAFQLINDQLGTKQIALDLSQTLLYGHDHATGGWSTISLTGVETPLESSPGTQFWSRPLRDISDVAFGEEVPEPAAWQLILAGAVCFAIARVRRT